MIYAFNPRYNFSFEGDYATVYPATKNLLEEFSNFTRNNIGGFRVSPPLEGNILTQLAIMSYFPRAQQSHDILNDERINMFNRWIGGFYAISMVHNPNEEFPVPDRNNLIGLTFPFPKVLIQRAFQSDIKSIRVSSANRPVSLVVGSKPRFTLPLESLFLGVKEIGTLFGIHTVSSTFDMVFSSRIGATHSLGFIPIEKRVTQEPDISERRSLADLINDGDEPQFGTELLSLLGF